MQDTGKQYAKDDRMDPSGLIRRARWHQSNFRAGYLNLTCDGYGNYLKEEDGKMGKKFYCGFGIFEAVKQYSKYKKSLYANMLRSEHIPFNVFIPLAKDRNFCKAVFSDILGSAISSIDSVEIEYAPKPREKYLNDRTAFDTCLTYTQIDGTKGMIGIEVKYTERDYQLKANSKEATNVMDQNSPYYTVTRRCGLYKSDAIKVLATDKFRQIWRNHILGESILLADKENFQHFTSLTLFPAGNQHFMKTSREYMDLLSHNHKKFIPLTYEDFFVLLSKHSPGKDYDHWIDYLQERYIVKND